MSSFQVEPVSNEYNYSSSSEPDEEVSESESPSEYTDEDEVVFEDTGFEDVADERCELPEPPPQLNGNQQAKLLLTWFVYFILVWQCKNYVSNNATEQLVKFLQKFFVCIGSVIAEHTDCDLIAVLVTNFPATLYSMRRFLNLDRDSFVKFVVCPKCMKLYEMDKVLYNNGLETIATTCSRVEFPQSKRPKVCGARLAQKILLKNGTSKFYALKTYCYKSIIESLESLLKRPGLEQACEKWKTRATNEDIYGDVYDGKVWKDFRRWNNSDFLNLPRSFGLMMNVDWFKPFKHRNDYSVGVIYMVLMNLPRSERFKRENVILVGIVPAFAHEPPSLNNFLEPAVDELRALWRGVQVNTYDSPNEGVEMRAALLCCASDIPAARKLCGFLGHSANRGCSHCYKFFPGGFGEPKDYSGFQDRQSWPRRTTEQHRRDAYKVKNCKSATERSKMASKLGSRYTILLELPYYSSITMCVIDPMHNLFLGTAKRVFSKWIEIMR